VGTALALRYSVRVTVAVLARWYPESKMADTTHDPRVDAYSESLPDWQQEICRRVRALVHAADPEVTETIKRTNRPYFVLHGNVCALLTAKDHVNVFLYDPLVPDPVAIYREEAINEEALGAMFRAIIAHNRAGGWRKIMRQQ
jgi:hypothetical protein